jgi:hypothetical protein
MRRYRKQDFKFSIKGDFWRDLFARYEVFPSLVKMQVCLTATSAATSDWDPDTLILEFNTHRIDLVGEGTIAQPGL